MLEQTLSIQPLKAKDFASDQDVRWCPGCGDYSILKALQKALAESGARRESTVVVSGIGCSSRLPYYLSTFGFHTIHGRAPAVATGIKIANPALDVWVVTGDGDCLSIGGNHALHALRRNINLNILLFNNEIYGLTKGQYSPTSAVGTRSSTSPKGSSEQPVKPCSFALGAGAGFIARSEATDQKRLPEILQRAKEHEGAAFVEILQNCIIFNDQAFDRFTASSVAADRQLFVRHGEPMLFGKAANMGVRMNQSTLKLEAFDLNDGVAGEKDVLLHDENNKFLAMLLMEMSYEVGFPMVFGVLYCNRDARYELDRHLTKEPDWQGLEQLFKGKSSWQV